MEDLRKQLEQAWIEVKRLKQEKEELRRRLNVENSAFLPTETVQLAPDSGINQLSTPKVKISLFRSLFRGREDVYAIRWENKAGKSGYSPACGNEWPSAKSLKSSAPSALISIFYRLRTKSSANILIRERIRRSGSIR